ncbi:SDR family oxidoreductase [Roseateles sp. DB2]|uniref:SDR family oxidoreductase n=1 Tax=Roseateles sp. DB2 TaxID=3453717 RepID=UPI003EEBF930
MIVIITGASDGIGAELARQWAERQGKTLSLVLSGRQLPKLQAVAAHCEALGATVKVHAADLAEQAACQGLIRAATEAFGGIDVLVNNAGMSAHALLEEVQDLAWYEQLMRVNHWSAVWCSHAALPWLKASQGRLVAVSSLAGLVGVPGRTAYSATKFAMTGFFEALRVELAPAGVSVTIAYPGVVATEIRYRGFGANGQPAGRSGLDERGAMSVDTCARLILDGTLQRERDIVMSAKGRLGRWLKLIAPGVVDRLARKALNKQH